MKRVREVLEIVAPSPLAVLLLGETGSGKEVAAEWLHARSGRPGDRFVKVNCASLSESLVESELFGHERGAFTGAHGPREGLFEAADGGTLFLDEVGELSLRTQAKLLRVLECGEIVRVGSNRVRCVDVRIVAATHRDIPALVDAGQFREDLYFRLNAVSLRVPPLRARREEIVPLATVFIERMATRLRRPAPPLSDGAIAALEAHAWPGNIRELRHVVERAVVLARGPELEPGDLELELRPVAAAAARIKDEVRSFEKDRIVAALARTGQNQTRAAALLGVSRRTLTNKLNAYGIDRPRKAPVEPPPSSERGAGAS